MYKKIIVPLDGSEFAESVLPHVRELAKVGQAEIELVIVALAAPSYMVETPVDLGDFNAYLKNNAITYAQGVAQQLRDEGLNVSIFVGNDDIAQAILEHSEKVGADLIAMTTHGRGGLSRWLMGSVADKILHSAKIPVLLVRPSASN